MGCEAVQAWSLGGLVAAFVELAIAYLLLCASAAAYVASKFLGFLGLSFPCPCDVTFLNLNARVLCLNRLLVEFPAQTVADVEQKLPFSHPKRHDSMVDVYYNSVEESRSWTRLDLARKQYDLKGKGIKSSNRSRSRLRRQKGGVHGKLPPLVSCDTPSNGDVLERGHYGHFGNGEARYLEYENTDPIEARLREMSIPSDENYSSNANMHEKEIYVEELYDHPPRAQSLSGDEENKVKLLEQTLAEERIARAALYIELEKERSAAASAADEAMAMILRLQEEKASIEIEARQYQRILEEKSAYDAEEMNILKEILVRREKEKLFLEKEVEAYRQMVGIGNEQADNPNSRHAMENEFSICFQNERSSFGNKRESDGRYVQMNAELQEKEFVSADNSSQLDAKVVEDIQEKNGGDKPAEKIIITYNGKETVKDPHFNDVHIVGDGIKRSSSETSCGLPPLKPSLSAVESEMVKIDCEVGRLRERLRLIQEGRDKLSLCAESRERENLQLKLLEDLARQVQEICQLTGPGKTLRQVSLPLPTSEVLSKKKRSRSVSSGLQRSSEGMIYYMQEQDIGHLYDNGLHALSMVLKSEATRVRKALVYSALHISYKGLFASKHCYVQR
ncbi:hypothetical protein STAS_18117 [Striga asiatica]|uniref:GTD-binding domain-containing protein n=1 Tax=Striga asiatica TaxID=4170 RepID=A0A5A7Q822_STRAF|nr:hypothetical protein STAS_18117 [Striga asiatica]